MNKNPPDVFKALGNVAALALPDVMVEKGEASQIIPERGHRKPRLSTATNRTSKFGSKLARRIARASARGSK